MLSQHVSSSSPMPIDFSEMVPRELFDENAKRYNPAHQIWDRNLKGALQATVTALETMMGHYYEHLKVPQSKRAGIVFVYHTLTLDSYVSGNLRKRHFIIWVRRVFDEQGFEQPKEQHILLAVEDTSEYNADNVNWETEGKRLHKILPLVCPTHRVLVHTPTETAFVIVWQGRPGGKPFRYVWALYMFLKDVFADRAERGEFMEILLQACIEAMYDLTMWWEDLGYQAPKYQAPAVPIVEEGDEEEDTEGEGGDEEGDEEEEEGEDEGDEDEDEDEDGEGDGDMAGEVEESMLRAMVTAYRLAEASVVPWGRALGMPTHNGTVRRTV